MKQELQDAIAAVRDDEPKVAVAESAAARVWARLAPHAAADGAAIEAIHGCGDVRALLPAHRRQELPAARALLVADHLRECAACRAAFREPDGPRLAVLPWRPSAAESRHEPRRYGHLAVAASLLIVAGALGWAAKERYFGVPAGSRATVQSVSGSLHRLDGGRALPLAPGAEIGEGEIVRTARGSRAVLRLRDGSNVEVGERAELAVRARGRDTTVHLERGSLIVEAAKRRTGHLRVASNDCTVSVTGTLFAVNRGIKGSRVSVLEGEVRVARAGEEQVLTPGDQWTTSPAMATVPLDDEIAWSADKDRHLALLAEWKALRQKWSAVETPGVRYESRLVGFLPEATVVVASLPNYGESLAQAHALFEERLQESQVLRDWWRQVDPARHGGPSLAAVVERIRDVSGFLGDEIVLALVETDRDVLPLLVAEVGKPGLREHIDGLLSASGEPEATLGIAGEGGRLGSGTRKPELFVLLRPGLVAVGPDEKTLLALDARREGAGAGLDQAPFGKRILEAFENGVGLLFAADLESITAKIAVNEVRDAQGRQALERTGLDAMRFLIVERKVVADESLTQAVVAFSGARRGIASWLAAPSPMGALDFVSPHAQAAAAFVTKSPALVFDDLTAIVSSGDARARSELQQLESKLDVRLRDDLAATLGGEFALSLDGPLLPTPAWKVVVEVYDPARLQATIERLVAAASDEAAREGRPGLRLESEQLEGATYHSIVGASPFELHYTFAGGYLVAGPSRALVMKAVRTFESGETLGGSPSFRSLFPPDRDAHVSGLVYQNFGPAVTSLLRAPGAAQITGEQKASIEALAGDAKPTLLTIYGEDDGIRVAGVGGAFGLDGSDLALPLLLERTMGGLPRQANP